MLGRWLRLGRTYISLFGWSKNFINVNNNYRGYSCRRVGAVAAAVPIGEIVLRSAAFIGVVELKLSCLERSDGRGKSTFHNLGSAEIYKTSENL